MRVYDHYECKLCGGTGERHDPTMAEWVGSRGANPCGYCGGSGEIVVLSGTTPPRYKAGALTKVAQPG